MKTVAIILAAGESKRMGSPKQILPFGDSTILGTVIQRLRESKIDRIVVVLGFHSYQITPAVRAHNVQVIVNPSPELGMLSSAQCALLHVEDEADAYLFALGDQPQIQPLVVNALIQAAEQSDRGIVLPICEGKRGHPLLVKSRHKTYILDLPLTGGLNQLLDLNQSDILEVEVESAAILQDIDTPEDYELARSPAPRA